MGALLAFLVGPIGRWLLMALAVTAIAAGVYHRVYQKGWNARDAIAKQEELVRADAAAKTLEEERSKLVAYRIELDGALQEEKARVAALEKSLKALFVKLKQETTRYVTKESDDRIAACGGIPRGFVVLHDRAARGDPGEAEVPAAADREALDRDSGIALSRVAEVMVENSGKFHECMTALKGWEAWYPAVKDIYNETLKGSP